MAISAADVKKLREMTGSGMMDCKKALTEAGGDFDKAVEILRKKGQKVSEKRSDREAKEGLVVTKISDDAKKAVAVELNCETDFVARNEEFGQTAEKFAQIAFDNDIDNAEDLKAQAFEGGTIAGKLEEMIGKIGEKIELSRAVLIKTEGHIVDYIHPGNQLAVLVEFSGSLSDAEVGKDVAMQIAAMNPIATRRDQVDTTLVEKEMEIAKDQLLNEGKPEHIAEQAAKGKIRRFYEERVLLEQKFVKDGSVSVQEYLKQQGAPDVSGFTRLQLGETNS